VSSALQPIELELAPFVVTQLMHSNLWFLAVSTCRERALNQSGNIYHSTAIPCITAARIFGFPRMPCARLLPATHAHYKGSWSAGTLCRAPLGVVRNRLNETLVCL